MSRKRTHSELYLMILDRLDEAGSPRFDQIQVARVFNQVYADWLKSICRINLEKNEQARRDLGPLTITTAPVTLTSNAVHLPGVTKDLYRLMSISGTWYRRIRDRPSGKIRVRIENWPISPITHDQLATAQTDYWNQPTDDQARYSESRHDDDPDKTERVTIHSITRPGQITITYVREPALVNFRKEPEGLTEVGYDTQIELMRRTVAILETTVENYPAAQGEYQEIQVTN